MKASFAGIQTFGISYRQRRSTECGIISAKIHVCKLLFRTIFYLIIIMNLERYIQKAAFISSKLMYQTLVRVTNSHNSDPLK